MEDEAVGADNRDSIIEFWRRRVKTVRRRALRGEMLCRRSVVEVDALARDFDEAHVACAAALSSVMRTVVCFLSENVTSAAWTRNFSGLDTKRLFNAELAGWPSTAISTA